MHHQSKQLRFSSFPFPFWKCTWIFLLGHRPFHVSHRGGPPLPAKRSQTGSGGQICDPHLANMCFLSPGQNDGYMMSL